VVAFYVFNRKNADDYHDEMNGDKIELAWASIKNYVRMNKRTFKINVVKKSLEERIKRVMTDTWKNFFGHVIKVEEKFWQVGFISDELLDAEEALHILTITDDTTDSDSDSN